MNVEVSADKSGYISISFDGKPCFTRGCIRLNHSGEVFSLEDGSLSFQRSERFERGVKFYYRCERGALSGEELCLVFESSGNALCVLAEPRFEKTGFGEPALTLSFKEVKGFSSALASTNLRLNKDVGEAFGYYSNGLALGKEPKTPKPSDKPVYPNPVKPSGPMDFSCWAFPYFLSSPEDVLPFTVHTLISFEDGFYASLAVASYGYGKSYIAGGEGLSIEVYLGCGSYAPSELLLASIGFSLDPYEAVETAYDVLAGKLGVKRRSEKRFPEVFKHLGWCSWNALVRDVDERSVLENVKGIVGKGVPVKFVIIDDGWLNVEDRRLLGFKPDPKKFPNGFKRLVEELRKVGVLKVGVWKTLQGYWRGLSPEGFKKYGEAVVKCSDGRVLPNPDGFKCFKLYFDFYSYLRGEGISFLKVDNQYDIIRCFRCLKPVGYAAAGLEYSMQSAALGNGLDVLNCMCMVPENFSFWPSTNVARVSEDYIPFWRGGAKLHTLYCVYNSLWYGQLTTPDFDMFMTGDPYGILHAVLRAISGGPVYITDRAETLNVEVAGMLAFSDGRVPMPDGVALPCRDCLFKDPYNGSTALKVFNRVGDKGLVAVFNITRDEVDVVAKVSAEDALLPAGRYVAYGVLSKTFTVLEEGGVVERTLKPLECELYVLSPLKEEVAVVGLVNLLIAPKGVSYEGRGDGGLELISEDRGVLAVYVEDAVSSVSVNGKPCKKVERLTGEPYTYTVRDRLVEVYVDRPGSLVIIRTR